jgi:stringent starvation protein B
VVAIYARENGQGMAFPQPESPGASDAATMPSRGLASVATSAASDAAATGSLLSVVPDAAIKAESPTDPTRPPPGPRPALKRIK